MFNLEGAYAYYIGIGFFALRRHRANASSGKRSPFSVAVPRTTLERASDRYD